MRKRAAIFWCPNRDGLPAGKRRPRPNWTQYLAKNWITRTQIPGRHHARPARADAPDQLHQGMEAHPMEARLPVVPPVSNLLWSERLTQAVRRLGSAFTTRKL